MTSTSRLTRYAILPKRGRETLETMGLLPDFQGVSVHDGWGSYRAYTICRHALCNAHRLRELTFLEEQYQQAWAADMKTLLREMKAATDHARTSAGACLPPAERADFMTRYHALVASGLVANPSPIRRRTSSAAEGAAVGWRSHRRNLLERLLLQQGQVLAFLDEVTIPFDNNQAERGLRGLKIQQKVSGCFRSAWGSEAHATIRGYLATLRKQGQSLLAALNTGFAGQPLYPASAGPATSNDGNGGASGNFR